MPIFKSGALGPSSASGGGDKTHGIVSDVLTAPGVGSGWPAPAEIDGLEVVAYTDLDARPAFKLALQRTGGRWYLFCGHLWHRGWTVLDVTDPAQPEPAAWIPGPANTWTTQVSVANGLLLAGLARIPPGWGGDPTGPFEEAAVVFDVGDPRNPRELARIRLGGTGSHRNWWAGGTHALLAANEAGYEHYSLVVVDLDDPESPDVVGRFWLPGQGPGESPASPTAGLSLHGPAYVVDRLAYLPYGGAGMVILDVADPTEPQLVSRFPVAPPFRGGLYGAGAHTVLPLPGRGLAVITGEAHAENCEEALSIAGIVDVSDAAAPMLLATLPLPIPPVGAGIRSYCDKGGRFGPHNSHLPQGNPDLEAREDRLYLTWFNAGLRVYDIADARAPKEIARFVPADPDRRFGPLPKSRLVAQSEDVLVDGRGYIYVSDKNQGIYILRM